MNHIHVESQRVLRKYRRLLDFRNQLMSCLLLLIDDPLYNCRRLVWSYDKNDKWWDELVPTMTEKQFKDNFRLKRSTFSDLLHHIGPFLQKNDTRLRSAVPVDKRIACSLYALGSSCELRTVANLFGLGRSTAGAILHEFCSVLVQQCFHRFVKFPNTDNEIRKTIDDFLNEYGYPMCLGALDGTHISLKPPRGAETDYFNYKKHHSVIMLAVVNSSLEFTYINLGAPGRCNDASVYARSALSEVVEGPSYSSHFIMINNVKIQAQLIADSAFSLNRTLMKPYPERPNMPRPQALFNYRLSRCRSTVERAFGALKNRFRCLRKRLEYNMKNINVIIKATTILHNLCVVSGDNYDIDWDVPEPIHKKQACNTVTSAGADVRESMTHFFLQNPL